MKVLPKGADSSWLMVYMIAALLGEGVDCVSLGWARQASLREGALVPSTC